MLRRCYLDSATLTRTLTRSASEASICHSSLALRVSVGNAVNSDRSGAAQLLIWKQRQGEGRCEMGGAEEEMHGHPQPVSPGIAQAFADVHEDDGKQN